MKMKMEASIGLGLLRRIISGGTFLILIAAIPTGLLAADRIDLNQALAIALKRNPSLAASRSDVDAARAGVTQATAAYYPQLKASTAYDRTWRDLEAGTGDRGDSTTETTDTYATGLSLSQYLFDFGKTPAEVDRRKKSLAVTEEQLTTVEKTLVRDVGPGLLRSAQEPGAGDGGPGEPDGASTALGPGQGPL
jgi:hypothetical protein